MNLILASKSPRRRELLDQLGYTFSCKNADIDESVLTNESAFEYVERLAIEKASAIANDDSVSPETAVLGSDTSVVINGEILGKPTDKADCIRQLTLLSGKEHQVLTAVAIFKNGESESVVVETKVNFKSLSISEIEAYWETGEPQDKAGSYGIQGIAGQFVTNISGSYFAVVGLPSYETVKLLESAGITAPLNQAINKGQ